MNKTRNSTVELLRIVAMLFIVWLHCAGRGLELFTPSEPTNCMMSGGGKSLSVIISFILGHTGVPIFMFISGYYGTHFRMNRLIDILSQTFLYVILFYFIACLFLPDVSVYKSVCQIFGINSVWFICYYVVLYICSDGINVALDRFDFRTFTFVVLLLLYISVGKWYARESGMTLFIMVEYYVLARYVRRFGSSYASLLKWAWIPALLMYLAPLCWGYYTGHYIWAFRFLHNYHNPLLFVFAMSIVVAADNWHTNVPAINYVAGSVLAVYMLHENAYAPDLLVTFFGFEHFSPLRSVIVVLAIFAVCVCVDKLRQRLTRKLLDRLNSLFVRAEGQVP